MKKNITEGYVRTYKWKPNGNNKYIFTIKNVSTQPVDVVNVSLNKGRKSIKYQGNQYDVINIQYTINYAYIIDKAYYKENRMKSKMILLTIVDIIDFHSNKTGNVVYSFDYQRKKTKPSLFLPSIMDIQTAEAKPTKQHLNGKLYVKILKGNLPPNWHISYSLNTNTEVMFMNKMLLRVPKKNGD